MAITRILLGRIWSGELITHNQLSGNQGKQVVEVARTHQLEIGNWQRYDNANLGHNAIRIGFASYTVKEIHELICRLKKTIKNITNKSILI